MKREKYTSSTPMPWGVHKGKPIGEVPATYLLDLLRQKWLPDWPDIHDYLKREKARLQQKVEANQPEDPTEGYLSYDDYLQDKPS